MTGAPQPSTSRASEAAERSRPGAGAALYAATYAACLLATLGLFFHEQLATGFSLLLGDRNDAAIEAAILEHWWNVVRGLAPSWATTFYFYPYEGTLGFNDGYFLYGLPYSAFRALGADPFLSSELVNVVLRAVAFAAFHVLLRQTLRVDRWWALLGAVLFTLSCTLAMRANHAQLLSVGFVPLFAWMVAKAGASSARPLRLVLWGSAAAVLMAAWLLTAFYMAWFTLFFLACYAALGALTAPRAAILRIRQLPRRSWAGLAMIAAVFAAAVAPFLALYLPKAAMTGMHPLAEVLPFTTEPLDLFHVGNGNLLFAGLDHWLLATFRPGFPRYSEHTTGLPPVVLVLFGLACVGLWSGRWRPTQGRALWLVATTAVATWLMTVQIGGWSAWAAVHALVPGAKAVRVVVRFQLFLAAPVIAIAVAYGSRPRAWAPAWLSGIIAAVLVAEQVTLLGPLALDRGAELAQLRSIPPPPAQCRAFFASRARAAIYFDAGVNAIYSHNVDAMLLAETFQLPTIDGFATFEPPDWDFIGPERPDHLQRVRHYVQAHGLIGVCAVDLRAGRWDVSPDL